MNDDAEVVRRKYLVPIRSYVDRLSATQPHILYSPSSHMCVVCLPLILSFYLFFVLLIDDVSRCASV